MTGIKHMSSFYCFIFSVRTRSCKVRRGTHHVHTNSNGNVIAVTSNISPKEDCTPQQKAVVKQKARSGGKAA